MIPGLSSMSGNEGVDGRLINLLDAYSAARFDPENINKRENLGRRLAEFNFTLVASLVTESGNAARHVYTDKAFREELKNLVLSWGDILNEDMPRQIDTTTKEEKSRGIFSK